MSAEIKSSPKEDYKVSEKEINNGVNNGPANTTICILKTFFPSCFTMSRVSGTLSAQIKHL